MCVGLLDLCQLGLLCLVLLESVLGQDDPVLHVGQGGAEVSLLVMLPPLVQGVTPLNSSVKSHAEKIFIIIVNFSKNIVLSSKLLFHWSRQESD